MADVDLQRNALRIELEYLCWRSAFALLPSESEAKSSVPFSIHDLSCHIHYSRQDIYIFIDPAMFPKFTMIRWMIIDTCTMSASSPFLAYPPSLPARSTITTGLASLLA